MIYEAQCVIRGNKGADLDLLQGTLPYSSIAMGSGAVSIAGTFMHHVSSPSHRLSEPFWAVMPKQSLEWL